MAKKKDTSPDPIDRKNKETSKEVQEFLDNVRNKSVRQIVKEGSAKLEEAKKEDEMTPPAEAEMDSPPSEKQEEKKEEPIEDTRKQELEEIKQAARQAAKEAAETSAKELKEEIVKIKESDKTEKEKKEEIKELKAKWTGVDPSSGVPTPKSYDEIVSEAVRLAKEEALKIYREQKGAELEELKKTQEEEVKTKETQDKQYQENLKAVNNKIQTELEELFAAGKLQKPKDPNDMNDPAAKRLRNLFEKAAAENIERQKNNKPLIDSIAGYLYLHPDAYEDKQPAGADAPIGGNQAPPAAEEERLNYYRDIHKPSFKQIMYRAKQQLLRQRG